MAQQKEIEIKFRIQDMQALQRRLRASGFRCVTPRTHEYNTLYDLPGQVLRRRGELLRLRKYGKKWILTHKAKGSAGRHKSRVETETEVGDGKALEHILDSRLDYGRHLTVEKEMGIDNSLELVEIAERPVPIRKSWHCD